MSSYIRLEILLFFRAFETGVGMLVVYRLTDMLKRRLFCDRMWNSTVDILYWLLAGLLLFTALYQCNYGRIRFFMLAGVAFGGIFANFVLNRLMLFSVAIFFIDSNQSSLFIQLIISLSDEPTG